MTVYLSRSKAPGDFMAVRGCAHSTFANLMRLKSRATPILGAPTTKRADASERERLIRRVTESA